MIKFEAGPNKWRPMRAAAISLLLLFIIYPSSAMTPSLMRVKELVQSDEGAFWEVRITCSDMETRRFIMQPEQGGKWCARDVPSLCDEEKIGAAVLVCAPEYRDYEREAEVVREAESREKADQKARLLQERVSLQQQRLELAERKLELGRREMNLREREVDLLARQSQLSQ